MPVTLAADIARAPFPFRDTFRDQEDLRSMKGSFGSTTAGHDRHKSASNSRCSDR